jgi:hypothetical protein
LLSRASRRLPQVEVEESRLSNEFSISSLHQDSGGWNQRT